MRISGLQKVTLLDFPGRIACTIFLSHCNLCCPFCHNMDLAKKPELYKEITIEEIIKFLEEKKGKLQGVAITGGEPLINDDIEKLLTPIKDMGFLIKLDTNGFFPDRLERILNEKLIDRVAMDIKAGISNYLNACGINEKSEPLWKEKINKSISLIMNSGIEYEFRTTCVNGIHTINDFVEIKNMIKGAKEYYLQNYNIAPGLENLNFKPFSKDELELFKNELSGIIQNIGIRGI